MNNTAIALLAKAPVPGHVKTRFTPPFTPELAANFAAAFLLDSVDVARSFPHVDLWASYLGDEKVLRDLLPATVGFIEQRGERLDDRISNCVADLRKDEYDRVIVVAADCPTIDDLYLEATLDSLETNDVVFGPAQDGGCVLVAVGPEAPDVFLGITMSTNAVYKEMIERAEKLGARTKTLPVLHDIDTVDELYAAERDGQLSHTRYTQRLLRAISSDA